MARQPFNTRWAQGVETEDNLNTFKVPDNARLISGWEGGQDKDAPPAGHENYWHNRVDSALQGVERNGVMDWHPKAVYGLGAPSYATDGNYYESLVAGNTGNDPTLTTGFWRYAGSTFFSGHEPGFVQMVAHSGVPSVGWLKCNGALLLRASYQRLFAMIGTAHNIGSETSLQFRLPDYRGEFIRGFDDGRGADPGRVFGSSQAAKAGSMDVRVSTLSMNPGAVPVLDTIVMNGVGFNDEGALRTVEMTAGDSRPRNKTSSYWIKY